MLEHIETGLAVMRKRAGEWKQETQALYDSLPEEAKETALASDLETLVTRLENLEEDIRYTEDDASAAKHSLELLTQEEAHE